MLLTVVWSGLVTVYPGPNSSFKAELSYPIEILQINKMNKFGSSLFLAPLKNGL